MSSLLIENLSVIATMDDEGSELRNQSILIEDRAITEIGPDLVAPPDARMIDGRGKVALPGFVNTHHHLWQTYCRDLPRTVNALDLFDWLVVKYGIWQEIDPELVYHASLVGLGMLLKTGCTLSSDNHVAFPRDKGGEEGTAVLITAGMIACRMIYMTDFHSSAPVHPFLFNTTGPELMRAQSASTAAMSRNSHLITVLSTSPAGGPGTETLLYECLAMGVLSSVSGVSVSQGVRSAVGVVENHVSGLEERFNAEASIAAAGMSREQADEIVKKAMAEYEPHMGAKPVGQPFWEVYDVLTLEPTAEWLGTYEKVKEQAIAWGLPMA